MNNYFQTSGNKKAPVNLYYGTLHSILSTNINSRNISGRYNKDISNASNNIIKSKRWNLSEMMDIKKKLDLALKKRKIIMNKKIKKKIPTLNHISINNINEGILNNKLNLNNTVRNKKILLSDKNSIKKNFNNSTRNYSNKGILVKKKINFNNTTNNSFKSYKSIKQKKKKIKNKIKNTIPFNINKISINIINNNNYNIKTLKTDGNIVNTQNEKFNRQKQRKKNFTLDKLPQFDELLKKYNTKEKDNKKLSYKIVKNKTNIFSKKRNNTNLSLSNRLNSIISIHDEISLLSKNFIKNIKKSSINKSKNLVYEKSIEHKKIIPINYFQDYKNKNSTTKNIKKRFLNFGDYMKAKNKRKNKKNNLLYKLKRPYSKDEKPNVIKIKKKSKEKVIRNKILKLVSKKCSLPETLLIKKINKKENNNQINILSKSEIKKRRAKSNNKSKVDETVKINIQNYNQIFDKMNETECTIDDVLQNKKIPEETDEFDDLYSIVKLINFNNIKKVDKVFSIDDNKNYLDYKNKFDKIWKYQK